MHVLTPYAGAWLPIAKFMGIMLLRTMVWKSFPKVLTIAWPAWAFLEAADVSIRGSWYTIPGLPSDSSVTRFRRTKYRGQPLDFSRNALIRTGETILELHLNNAVVRELASRNENPIFVARQEMIRVAAWLGDPARKEIRAIRATTILAREAEYALCMEIRERPRSIRTFFEWMGAVGFLFMYGAHNGKPPALQKYARLVDAWIPRETFLEVWLGENGKRRYR